MEQVKGIFAATLSLLDKNLALDIKNTIKHAENIIDNGCHGVVFFGSTGQSQLISLSEKIQLINHLPKSKYNPLGLKLYWDRLKMISYLFYSL